MDLNEYASHDGLGLAALVKRGEVTPCELAETARRAVDTVNPSINAVVETYADRTTGLDDTTLEDGPFRGVPFLIKDIVGHEGGRTIEFGSRLCRGMVATVDTFFFRLLKDSGINVLGRSNAPEYSISASTESLLHGDVATPWRAGHSAGGSSGGAAAAVAAGIVPLAHGSDAAGSIRIPAAWCGVVGLKPSRGLISSGPNEDESGFGLSVSFVLSRSMRDTAVMLDCLAVPQVGDPFVVTRPDDGYTAYLSGPRRSLRIGWTAEALMDAPVDPEIAAATRSVANRLADMGHTVEGSDLPFDHEQASRVVADFWLFGFHLRLDDLARRINRRIGPETLEPMVLEIYERSRELGAHHFLEARAWLNGARRRLGDHLARFDVVLTPTTAQVSPPHGVFGPDRRYPSVEEYLACMDRAVQYSLPFNVAGAPAISMPLAEHSSGLPIGIQLGAGPSHDHLLIRLGAELERALPWAGRTPPVHVSRS